MSRIDLKEYLTVREVAELLQLSVLTIYKYIKLDHLKAIAFGRHYRVSRDALETFINEHKV